MREVSAHDLAETRDCRRPNCTNDASSSAWKGPYANLCDQHVAEARRERSENLKGKPRGGRVDNPIATRYQEIYRTGSDSSPSSEGPKPEGRSLVEVCKTLVPAARELEGSLVTKKVATARARAAFEEFSAALRAVKETAQGLLDA
jgi:hypothetical protein